MNRSYFVYDLFGFGCFYRVFKIYILFGVIVLVLFGLFSFLIVVFLKKMWLI